MDHASQPALELYNKIFGSKLSGDFEGYLVVELASGTLRIFASGDVVTFVPNDPKQPAVSYPSDFVDVLRADLFKMGNL